MKIGFYMATSKGPAKELHAKAIHLEKVDNNTAKRPSGQHFMKEALKENFNPKLRVKYLDMDLFSCSPHYLKNQ